MTLTDNVIILSFFHIT